MNVKNLELEHCYKNYYHYPPVIQFSNDDFCFNAEGSLYWLNLVNAIDTNTSNAIHWSSSYGHSSISVKNNVVIFEVIIHTHIYKNRLIFKLPGSACRNAFIKADRLTTEWKR